MLPLSRRIAVSANIIFFPLYPTRNKVYLILSYLSISAFPPESRTRKAANFPSIWY